jgi:hypothetical protein
MHSVTLNNRALPELPSVPKFAIPKDAGARVAMVARAMGEFRHSDEILVWFDDWSVWPSGQRMHVFDRFRLGYGEARSISNAPGHILKADEIEDATSLVTIGVLFLWDCYVLTQQDNRTLFFSHDEWGLSSSSPAPIGGVI